MTPEPISTLTTLKNLGYVIAGILGIKYDIAFAFGGLLLMDVITGTIASATCCGWRAVTSNKFIIGVLAKLLMIFMPLAVALTAIVVGMDLKFLVSSAISIMAIGEAYSICGNVYTIKSGKRVAEFDAISLILNNIREVLLKPLLDRGSGKR